MYVAGELLCNEENGILQLWSWDSFWSVWAQIQQRVDRKAWKRIESKNAAGFRFFIFKNVSYSDELNKIRKFLYHSSSWKVAVSTPVSNNNLLSA